MVIGYAGVPTKSRGPEHPRQALVAGCKSISSPSGRSECRRAPDQLRLRDSVGALRPDSVARSTANLLNGAAEHDQKECVTVSQAARIDTRARSGPLGFTVLGTLAQIEREILPECTCAAHRSAKKRGKLRGRQSAFDNPDLARQARQILTARRVSKRTVARRPGTSLSTLPSWFRNCNPRAFAARICVSRWSGQA